MISNSLYFLIILLISFEKSKCYKKDLSQLAFPENFLFGVSTASYQIEGAWNQSGKGENIWDYLAHNNPSHIVDKSNGDIACDSYNKYKEDVQLVKSLGMNFYRFSLSWSRILPTGYPNYINQDGIRFYNNLINELIANGIEPMITLYHWDLPQPLQEIGGWPNPALAEHFTNYARIAFENFGDRVKTWITINEPLQICKIGYGDKVYAPAYASSAMADYMCGYTIIRAHSLAYHLYNDSFRPTQKGIIGLTIQSFWFDPITNSKADIEAAERAFEFYTGMYANPIFGSGDWPNVVKEYIGNMSRAQNFTSSRLPSFTDKEIQNNRGTSDFFGLNYYFAVKVSSIDTILYPVAWNNDAKLTYYWTNDMETMLKTPALRKMINKLRGKYGDIRVIITENGLGTEVDNIKDYDRANYIMVYLEECLNAIHKDDINLIGYSAWSLLDNFEWELGYRSKFGIFSVDFNHPNRTRTRRHSADIYEKIARTRKLPVQTFQYSTSSASYKTSTIVVPLLFLMLVLLK